jgi:nicotinamidase-related amidase
MNNKIHDKVCVVIDMQNGFDLPGWPNRWNENVDKNGIAILEAFRSSGRTIIHVRHDSIVPRGTLTPGQVGNHFRPGFEPLEGEAIVSKSVNSAFIGTDLDLRLRRLNAQSIVVFGISTDMCVSTTIRMGSNIGWSIVLVEDACDCFALPTKNDASISAKAIHDAHVATLGFEFCQVLSTDEMLASLV